MRNEIMIALAAAIFSYVGGLFSGDFVNEKLFGVRYCKAAPAEINGQRQWTRASTSDGVYMLEGSGNYRIAPSSVGNNFDDTAHPIADILINKKIEITGNQTIYISATEFLEAEVKKSGILTGFFLVSSKPECNN